MLETTTINSETLHKVEATIHPITDQYALFKCTRKTIKNGVTQETETVSGISETQIIKDIVDNGNIPKPKSNFVIMDQKLQDAFRKYGFPNHSAHDSVVFEKDGEKEYPFDVFTTLLDERVVTFEKINNNPALIDDIVMLDNANYNVFNLKTNKHINTALFTSWLGIKNDYIKNFPDVITDLFKQGRLAASLSYRNELLSWYTGSGYDVNARVVFTDEEFDALAKHEKLLREKESNESHDYIFRLLPQALLETNTLNISEYFYGYESNNVFETKPYESAEDF